MNALAGNQMQTAIVGDGEPLVLVPGGLTGWLSWQPHAEQLAEDYRVIRVQLLSVELGLEQAPLPAGYSILTEKEALRNTLDHLDVHTADFAGWSYGALTSLRFALDHPDRVRSLTLIEPPAFWVLRSRSPLGDEAQAEQRLFESFGPGAISEKQLEDFIHLVGLIPPDGNAREMPQWPLWAEHRQSLRTAHVPYLLEDDIARLRTFDKPVLLLKGEGSQEFLHNIIDILGEELPNARVETLPGGHAAHIVSMEPFMLMLREFLEDARR